MTKKIKTMLSFAAVLSAVAFSAISCDPEGPVDEGEGNGPTEEQLAFADSVENALYRQARAMQVLLTGEAVQISSCQATRTEGQYEITLSTGASFVGYEGEDEGRETILTVVKDEEAMFWATYGEDGTASAVKNDQGESVALAAAVDFSVKDGKVELVLDEKHYPLGYSMEDNLQVFDFQLLVDENGAVFAVRFDFGSEEYRTVYLSAYTGARFYFLNDESKAPVTELCVDWGTSQKLGIYVPEGVEYKFIAPDKWTVSLTEDSTPTVVVAAPQTPDESSATGTVEAVSSDESFTFARLNVTTEPFRTLFASAREAVVVPSQGVDKFAYGISLKSDFDPAATLSNALKWMAGEATPEVGGGVATEAVSEQFSEILGTELDDEAEYVLWAVANGHLKSVEFIKIKSDIQAVDTYLLDAELEVSVKGADAVFGGVVKKEGDYMADILYQLNNSILDSIPVTSRNFVYEGLMSDFPAVDSYKNEILPATTYVVWTSPAYNADYEYSELDVYLKEVKTNDLTEGGVLSASFGEVTMGPSTFDVQIKAEGAAMIYYALLNKSNGDRYSASEVPNSEKFKQIMANSPQTVKSAEASAAFARLNPNTTYWVYAVAVDADGKYGPVTCVSGKTQALVYDTSISLSVEVLEKTAKKLVFKVASEGGDLSDYIYWVGRVTDPFWANSTYCGGSKTTGQKYMALNPDDENITKAMNKYGQIAADGTLTVTDLTMETTYVFIILEKGESYYSQAAKTEAATLAADLGVVVREGTDQWKAARNTIGLGWHKDKFNQVPHLGAYYSFDFTCPKEYTAYIMCAGEGYYEELNYIRKEQFMIDIENYASRRIDKDHVPYGEDGNYLQEPDYYKNGVLTEGQLMSVNDFYAHGAPLFGGVTYFAENSHKEGNCISWENGGCANYKRAEEMIAYYNTIEPYEKRAEAFGLEGKEAADWALALKEAYSFYYKDAKPLIYINDGSPLYVVNASATGVNEDGVVPDRVYVMLKDLQGNYYEPMCFEVPNYFEQK